MDAPPHQVAPMTRPLLFPRSFAFVSASSAVLLALAFACSPGADGSDGKGGGNGDGNGDSGSDLDLDSGDDGNDGGLDGLDPSERPPTEGCGDGVLTEDEACDDGNRDAGDGCHSNCRVLDPGFTCPTPGEACKPYAKCGDGIVSFPEQCDDGATEVGDGCSATCKVEIGFKCGGEPSTCDETTCGDGVKEGAETCEDTPIGGVPVPFDGCNEHCQAEPNCGLAGCTSQCGDGLVLGDEECDDGNSVSGDGCSSDCEEEEGYVCTQAPDCEMIGDKCAIRIPAVFRDFNESHSDFEVGCGSMKAGVVKNLLDAGGKPDLLSNADVCIESSASFDQWYVQTTGQNSSILGQILLFENGSGGYVNRYGADGAKWNGTLDGNPLFFPIDDSPLALSDTRSLAKIPQEVYGGNWADDPSGKLRNFHFTTEVAYWFQYESDTNATLEFVGDDDVWVFVNRRLAVDLGGLHVPEDGSVTINSTTASTFALTPGKVYEIKVFHAERKRTGSSFKLTLSGFNTSRSECVPQCGDGIIGAGEECDDGKNDGGYNECQPGCVLGGFCGDGIKQQNEDCDDNDPSAPQGCSGCRVLVVK